MIPFIPLFFLIAIGISAPVQLPDLPSLKSAIKSVPDTNTFLQKIPFLPIFVYGILLLLFAVTFWAYMKCRRSRQPTTGRRRAKNNGSSNCENVPLREGRRELVSLLNSYELDFHPSFELNPDQLRTDEVLGTGHYGVVHRGKLGDQLDVAIKRARYPYDPTQQKMMIDELKIMCAIGTHPYVLALVGGVTSQGIETIVTEYADCRSLKDFLTKIRSEEKFTDLLIYDSNQQKTKQYKKGVLSRNMNAISTIDLLSFAYQIATGMVHLVGIPCVHRDLALRNVLVMADGSIRIGDFGLTRRHDNKEYYRIASPEIELPFKWADPESFSREKFDEKTDIWSFGISLFELFTLGGSPYEGIQDISGYLKSGKRLEEPKYCHPEIYEFMKNCWSVDLACRPNFEKCAEFFKEHLMMIDKNSYQKLKDNQKLIIEKRCEMERQVQRFSG